MYVYMYVYMCVCVCVYESPSPRARKLVCESITAVVSGTRYECMYVCVYMYVCLYVCVCIYVYVCIYIYIYVCIRVCVYIYTYTHTHIHRRPQPAESPLPDHNISSHTANTANAGWGSRLSKPQCSFFGTGLVCLSVNAGNEIGNVLRLAFLFETLARQV
jgi:hypothetical protein